MKPSSLNLDNYAQLFSDYLKSPKQTDNLFVITHLGQLKQMEALITKKNLSNNGLVVLYTVANFAVPQMVHDKATASLFDFVIFVEIPFKVNQVNYFKLKKVYETYLNLLNASKPSHLYLNSFEGHYAILIDIAKQRDIKNILVEEGTATYKLNLSNVDNSDAKNYQFFVSEFMDTVGKTQIFKKTVKAKKNIKELSSQTKKLFGELWHSKPIQQKIISHFGDDKLLAVFQPAKKFDKIYASYPELLDKSFDGSKEYFLGGLSWSAEESNFSKAIVDRYQINEDDALFLSQRYGMNADFYALAVCGILNEVVDNDKRIFIKLHPKEDSNVLNAFQQAIQQYQNRFCLIEESDFLIESVLYESDIKTIIGLTSSTLIYAPLLYDGVRPISIANLLIEEMATNGAIKTEILDTIREHLAIIRLFDVVEIL